MKQIILKRKKHAIVLFLSLLACFGSWAQTNVRGKITDDKGAGLSGASILLKGSTTGAGTDADGNFSINVPSGKGTLVVSSVGFVTQEVPVNGRSNLNITLTPDVKSLE